MEPGIIALIVFVSVGGTIALAAIGTHLYEWRYLWLKQKRQAQEDLENSAATSQEKNCALSPNSFSQSSPNTAGAVGGFGTNAKSQDNTGCAMLTSPAFAAPVLSPISTTSHILHITTPKETTAPPMMYSPTTPQTSGLPLTPVTAALRSPLSPTPLLNKSTDDRTLFYDSRPLLVPTPYSTYASGEDNYTRLAPRVNGSKVRRFATPPRQLKLSIPPQESNWTTRRVSSSHRRIPSSPKITAPPRILARSVTELVGVPENECEVTSELYEATVRQTDKSLNQVGAFGW